MLPFLTNDTVEQTSQPHPTGATTAGKHRNRQHTPKQADTKQAVRSFHFSVACLTYSCNIPLQIKSRFIVSTDGSTQINASPEPLPILHNGDRGLS